MKQYVRGRRAQPFLCASKTVMKGLMHRPLAWACGSFVILIYLSFYLPSFVKIIFAVLAVAAMVGFAAAARKYSRLKQYSSLVLCVASAALLAFAICYYTQDIKIAGICKYAGREATLEATVTEILYNKDYGAAYKIRVNRIDGRKTKFSCLLETDFPFDTDAYETIEVRAKLDYLSEEYDASYRLWYFSREIYLGAAALSDSESRMIGASHQELGYLFDRVRSACSVTFLQYLDKDTAAMSKALLLGDRGELSAVVKRDFRRLGVSHMLAVSGMHLSILIGGLEYFLRLLTLHRKLRNAVLMVSILVFIGITGAPPSILRSGIMWLIYYGAYYAGGRQDSVTSLFFSVAAICFVSPSAVFDVGLQLSFLSSLGIVLLGGATRDRLLSKLPGRGLPFKILKAALNNCICTVSAVIFTLPVLLFTFHEFSLISLLSNLMLNVPVTVLMYAAPLLILTSTFPVLPYGFAAVISLCTEAVYAISAVLSSVPNALVSTNYSFAFPVFLAFLVLSAAFMIRKKNILTLYAGFLCGVLLFAGCLFVYQQTQRNIAAVTYENVKKNDLISVECNQKALLCDFTDGSYKAVSAGLDNILSGSCVEIESWVITHVHTRHIATFQRVAQETVLQNLYMPLPANEKDEGICSTIAEKAHEYGITVYYIDNTLTEVSLSFETLNITLFPQTKLARSTHPVLAMSIANEGSDTQILYAGASSCETDGTYAQLLRDFSSASDIMLFGSHGPIIKQMFGMDLIPETSGKGNLPEKAWQHVIYANKDVFGMAEPAFVQILEEAEISQTSDSFYRILVYP